VPARPAREPRLDAALDPRADARTGRVAARQPAIRTLAREARAHAHRRRAAERVLGAEARAADHGRRARTRTFDVHRGAGLGPHARTVHPAAELELELLAELVSEPESKVG